MDNDLDCSQEDNWEWKVYPDSQLEWWIQPHKWDFGSNHNLEDGFQKATGKKSIQGKRNWLHKIAENVGSLWDI